MFPPLDPNDRTAVLSVKLPSRLLARLKDEAAYRKAGTPSDVLRSLITAWLASEGDSRLVGSGELREKLRPIVKELKVEGRKNMATMAPAEVLRLAIQLERVLDGWGGSAPHGDVPASFARSAQRRFNDAKGAKR